MEKDHRIHESNRKEFSGFFGAGGPIPRGCANKVPRVVRFASVLLSLFLFIGCAESRSINDLAAGVDGGTDIGVVVCPSIYDMGATPHTQSVGDAVELEPDIDFGDYDKSEVAFYWSSSPSGGSFDDPTDSFTNYNCTSSGDFTLTLFVNRDGPCSSSERVDVTCGVCGDGIHDSNEECDDGDTMSNDGCSYDCRIENTECTASYSISGRVFFTTHGVCQSPSDKCVGGTPDQFDVISLLPIFSTAPYERPSAAGNCSSNSVCCMGIDECEQVGEQLSNSALLSFLFPRDSFTCVPTGTCVATNDRNPRGELNVGCPSGESCCVMSAPQSNIYVDAGIPQRNLDAGVYPNGAKTPST